MNIPWYIKAMFINAVHMSTALLLLWGDATADFKP